MRPGAVDQELDEEKIEEDEGEEEEDDEEGEEREGEGDSEQYSRTGSKGPEGEEICRVLGGGVVLAYYLFFEPFSHFPSTPSLPITGRFRGSLVLVSGSPGAGKSTLLLQLAGLLAEEARGSLTGASPPAVLYVSGEEVGWGSEFGGGDAPFCLLSQTGGSPAAREEQLATRAKRLRITSDNLFLLSENNLEGPARTDVTLNASPFAVFDSHIRVDLAAKVPSVCPEPARDHAVSPPHYHLVPAAPCPGQRILEGISEIEPCAVIVDWTGLDSDHAHPGGHGGDRAARCGKHTGGDHRDRAARCDCGLHSDHAPARCHRLIGQRQPGAGVHAAATGGQEPRHLHPACVVSPDPFSNRYISCCHIPASSLLSSHQVRECTLLLLLEAKNRGIPIFIVSYAALPTIPSAAPFCRPLLPPPSAALPPASHGGVAGEFRRGPN
ncbi:unnamed protein product [Closterium sp. Naga37s-1]|nr:unnamed protein product [Closterium sp. Naga37s-1]